MDTDGVVVYVYTLDQAIADGELVELFKHRWDELTGGKPLVATKHIFQELSLVAFMDIWNEYVLWQKRIRSESESEDIFTVNMNGKRVWVMEDDQAYTVLYSEDY
jgi:hypothetical protein